jgi:hypothetical protein
MTEQEQDKIFRQVILGEGQVPLTDDLIQELVKKGWPEKDLRIFKAQGAMYSVPRNSIIHQPFMELFT